MNKNNDKNITILNNIKLNVCYAQFQYKQTR